MTLTTGWKQSPEQRHGTPGQRFTLQVDLAVSGHNTSDPLTPPPACGPQQLFTRRRP